MALEGPELASEWALRNSLSASPVFLANLGSWLPPKRTTRAIRIQYQSPVMFASTAPMLLRGGAAVPSRD